MRSPVSPLNKAFYDRLKAKLTTAVYDYVPEGKTAPYIVLTDTVAVPWGSKNMKGYEVLATIAVISEYKGDKESAEIADAAITAVNSPVMTLPNDWTIAIQSIAKHSVERFAMHREATIQFKFIIIDTKE